MLSIYLAPPLDRSGRIPRNHRPCLTLLRRKCSARERGCSWPLSPEQGNQSQWICCLILLRCCGQPHPDTLFTSQQPQRKREDRIIINARGLGINSVSHLGTQAQPLRTNTQCRRGLRRAKDLFITVLFGQHVGFAAFLRDAKDSVLRP
jgi:hypothetical protein